ncbi:MAG: alpha/beta fold hydrolase [Rubrivivax sp.]|nr:alpha/beta fold hydrolase [Rubrivivax sp.]
MDATLDRPPARKPSRRWMRRRWWMAIPATAAVLWAAAVAALWFGQERLLFRPSTLPQDHRFPVDADVHETWIDVPGARLNALHLKLPNPDGVVFYLHGNGSSLQGWFVDPKLYRAANVDLVMIDYRGYGKSSGRIASEAQLLDDVRAAWRQVAPAYAGKRWIFFGRSLGTGLAARLAAEVQPDLTVLVSPYASMVQLAAEAYPWVPAPVLRYPLRSDLALPEVRGAVLLLHGERDTLIPISHSERLLSLARSARQARLVRLPAAAHGDVHHPDAYRDALATALRAALAATPLPR